MPEEDVEAIPHAPADIKQSALTEDENDVISYEMGDNLEIFRKAYKDGCDVTFCYGRARFTYNVNNPLVAYSHVESGGTAVSDGYGHLVRGEYYESLSGQYNRRSGAAQGKWTHKASCSGGVGGYSKEFTAVYEDGRLVDGTLGGAGSFGPYQKPPPKLKILGQKTAVPK